MKKFPAIQSGLRLAEEKENGGWKLVRRGSSTALFQTIGKLKQFVRNRKFENFRLVNPDGTWESIK